MTIKEWIDKNLKSIDPEMREDVISFLNSQYSNKRSINFNLEQCLEKMLELSKKTKIPKFNGKVRLVYNTKNFSIFKLEDQISIKHEGLLQDNCLSDLTSPFVHLDGSIDYFTIRDKKQNPVATLSIVNESLLELKGYQNKAVKHRYLKEILEAIDSLKINIDKFEEIGLVNVSWIRKFEKFEKSFKNIKKIEFKNETYIYSKNFIKYEGEDSIEDKFIFLSTMISYDFNKESIINLLNFCKEKTEYDKIEDLVEKIKFKNSTMIRSISDFLISYQMNSIHSAMNYVFLAERDSQLLLKIWKKYEEYPIVREFIASRFSQTTKGWVIYKELDSKITFNNSEYLIILANLMKSLSDRKAKRETLLELVKKIENEEGFKKSIHNLAINAIMKNASNCYHMTAHISVENILWLSKVFEIDLESIKKPILYSARFDKNMHLLNFIFENLSLSIEDCLIIKDSIKKQSDSFRMLLKSLKALAKYEKTILP